MKPKTTLLLLPIVLTAALHSVAFAQPANADATGANQPGIKAESDPSSTNKSETTEANDEFQPAPGALHREVIVSFHNVELRTNETAENIVVIGANAKINGKVKQNVVVIGGDATVNGLVRENMVTILGDLFAGKGARFGEDTVVVGGRLESADDVKFQHNPTIIEDPGIGRAIKTWVIQCVFKLRPLAPQVAWLWPIWGVFFLIYFLVALILPTPVGACAAELTRRPASTFFIGLLAKILIPLVMGILVATGIGAIVVPFILAALIFGAIVGKVGLFAFLGGVLGRRFGTGILQNSLLAFLVGILLITVIYMVPVLGLIALGVVSVWGLGAAVTAAFWGLRKEMPDRKIVAPPGSAPLAAAGMATASAATGGAAFSADVPSGGNPAASGGLGATGAMPEASSVPGTQAPPAAASMSTNIPEAYAYPRAGFWERLGAAFLDMVLLGFLGGIVSSRAHVPALPFLITLAYFAGMWAWKGTTIGGVVLGLKVVRQDGYPVTLLVSIVRALAAAFSIVIFFLGFLWIVFDREKQGWHDKIAGTVVIKLPKGTPLVLF